MTGVSDPNHALRISAMVVFAATMLAGGSCPAAEEPANLATISLFDGERRELFNTWGGAWGIGSMRGISVQSQCVHSGRHALCVELGAVEAGQARHFQCLASGFGRAESYHQTRDLTRYERLEFHVRNATSAAMRGTIQIKDYRDALEHRALYQFELPATSAWGHVSVPLTITDAGWTLHGQPDLSRVLTIDFMVEPQAALSGGQTYWDDLVLVEPGGQVNIDTSPLPLLVERLARRQWDALWAARSRDHGLIPNHSYQSTDAGLNTTAAVLWMLPAATRRNWVTSKEAEGYVAQLAKTLDRLLDRAEHLPPRSMDWVTLKPSIPEESSVDAAFLALALHQYKSQSTTSPMLREAIGRIQDRFNFAPFACPVGWSMAYRYAPPKGFVALTYNGYTNEAKVVSLAAHLSKRHHVPIETCWNTDVHRVRAQLVGFNRAPVVHALSEFRAPFTQALLNLFVDVRERGLDQYPDNHLAANPWQNFVCYQQGVMARLAELGRPYLVQPDAGDDGSLTNYQQFSLYADFGQSDLFMPWSVAFALLAGADRADEALRFLLRHHLHGPLGLADSAQWETGAPQPRTVTARHDFWNTALSTIALLEWLDGDARLSKSFAALPEVREALDRVFPTGPRTAAKPNQIAVQTPGSHGISELGRGDRQGTPLPANPTAAN